MTLTLKRRCEMDEPMLHNYETTDTCDGCGEREDGTMFHAMGATGRICPVLFLCHKCTHQKEATCV